MELEFIQRIRRYGSWAVLQLLDGACKLTDAALDERFDMGPGSLRRAFLHLYNGELVWLGRWRGARDTPWPSEDEPVSIATLRERFAANDAAQAAFLHTVSASDLDNPITYRDSRGSLFSATLRDMLIQGILHSHHHRAQAANMLRRAGGPALDLDYMYHVRLPA